MTGILIELEVEAAPVVRIVCCNEGEETRIKDWLRAKADYGDLVTRALELAQEARTA